MKEDYLVADLAGETHLVGDHDHGPSLAGEPTYHLQDLAHQFRVQRRRGLIEEQHVGLHGQRPGDVGALLLAARDVGRVVIPALIHADLAQDGIGPFAGLTLRHFQDVDRRLDDVLHDGHVGPQVEALEHHAEAGADALDLPAVRRFHPAVAAGTHFDGLTLDGDGARIRSLQEVDAAQERALAGARRAEHGNHVAVAGGDRDALQHLDVAEALVDVLDHEGRFRHRASLRPTSPAGNSAYVPYV